MITKILDMKMTLPVLARAAFYAHSAIVLE